jgi:hypothetical protein
MSFQSPGAGFHPSGAEGARYTAASGLINALTGFEFLHPPFDRFLIETPVWSDLKSWNAAPF